MAIEPRNRRVLGLQSSTAVERAKKNCDKSQKTKRKPLFNKGLRPIARSGLEPELSDSESLVLPLHHQAR